MISLSYFSISSLTFLISSQFFLLPATTTAFSDCIVTLEEEQQQWVNDGGFLILLLTVVICFWGLAIVCEDYYVPALSLLCQNYNIPDAVAGATFMAAGASSPELFVSISALFIESSSVGLGTVIGSEIFNHLIIAAGSIMYARGGELPLDKRILLKDCLFYVLTLIFLIIAIKDDTDASFRDAFDKDSWEDCLRITSGKSAWLFIFYGIYAAVTSYFDDFCNFLGIPDTTKRRTTNNPKSELSTSMLEEARILHSDHNPLQHSIISRGTSPSKGDAETSNAFGSPNKRQSMAVSLHNAALGALEALTGMATDLTVNDLEFVGDSMCFYSDLKSEFFEKLGVDRKVWKQHYFMVSSTTLSFVRNKNDPKTGDHVFIYPLHDCLGISITNVLELEFTILWRDRRLLLRAPHPELLYAVIEIITEKMSRLQSNSKDENERQFSSAKEAIQKQDSNSHNILTYPGGKSQRIWWWITCPLRYIIYYTLYDMQLKQNSRKYGRVCILCLVYLAGLSVVLIECCSLLGRWMKVSDVVIGITISAIGTSFPNLWSSMVVARQGQGNMAICNSLGSNIFNIGVALGFPWLLYTLTELKGKPYEGLQDGGVIMLCYVLIIVTFFYILMIWYEDWVMKTYMVYIFVAVYIAVIALVITII